MSNVKADDFKNITKHKVDVFTTNTTPRRVGKFDLKGNLICEFDTVREAKRDTVGAPMVLTGRRKQLEDSFLSIFKKKVKDIV